MSKLTVESEQLLGARHQDQANGHFTLYEEEDEHGNMCGVRLICPPLRDGAQGAPLHVWLPYDHEQGNLFLKDQAKQCINEHLHKANYTHHELHKLLSTVRPQKEEENGTSTEFSNLCNIAYETIEESLVLKLPKDVFLPEEQSEQVARSLNMYLLPALHEVWKDGIIKTWKNRMARGGRPSKLLKAITAWQSSWEQGRGELQRLARHPLHGDNVMEHATLQDFEHLLGLAAQLPDLQTKNSGEKLSRGLQPYVGSDQHQIQFNRTPHILKGFENGLEIIRQTAHVFSENISIDGPVAADTIECDTGSLSSNTNARTERTEGRCTQLTDFDGSAASATGTSKLDMYSTNHEIRASLSEKPAGRSSQPCVGGSADSYQTVGSDREAISQVPFGDGSIREEQVQSLLGRTEYACDAMTTLHRSRTGSTVQSSKKRRRSSSNGAESVRRSKASC